MIFDLDLEAIYGSESNASDESVSLSVVANNYWALSLEDPPPVYLLTDWKIVESSTRAICVESCGERAWLAKDMIQELPESMVRHEVKNKNGKALMVHPEVAKSKTNIDWVIEQTGS